MGWGAMMGLGQSLQQVGGMLSDNYKAKLAERLEKEKEDRANARADLVHERDQLEFDHESPVMEDGVWFNVKYNKKGNVMDKTLAPQSTIDSLNMAKDKEKASLEKTLADTAKSKKELENYDQEAADKHALTTAQAGYYRDSGLGRLMTAGKKADSESTGNIEDATDDLVKDTSDIQKQYTTKQGDEDPLMTATEYRMVAKDAVKAAAQRGIDPRSFLTDQLRLYIQKKNKLSGN